MNDIVTALASSWAPPNYGGSIVLALGSHVKRVTSIDANLRPQWRIVYSLPNLMLLQDIVSGDRTQQSETVVALKSQGHRITFIAPRNTNEIVCTDQLEEPVLARCTWSQSLLFNSAAKGCWRAQQLLGVPYLNYFSNLRLYDAAIHCFPGHDLVHERCSLYRVGVARACRRLRLPYVLFFDADELLEADFQGIPITGLLRWRAEQMMRYCLEAADRVIAVCEPARRHLTDRWQVSSEKIDVLPNAVDIHKHRPYPDQRASVRAKYGIGEEPTVIFVSSFYLWHDIPTALNAFAQVLVTHPTARLLLVGDGSLRPAMQTMANELGIAQQVVFTGLIPHAEVPALVSACDVALALYPKMEQEFWGSPMKVFEYMASETAIVATATGQLPDVLTHGYSALLTQPSDARDVAAAIRLSFDAPQLRTQLGQQARQDALQKHSWEIYVHRLESIYTRTLNYSRQDTGVMPSGE